MSTRTTLALAAALATLPALAQERPSEGDLFGGETPATQEASPAPADAPRPDESALFGDAPEAPPAAAAPESQDPRPGDRDAQALDGPAATNAFDTEDAVEDPLKIGGRFYLRALSQGSEGVSFGNTSLSAPMLVDGYFDARPTDRLRGFVLGRLTFDPTRKEGSGSLVPSVSSASAAAAEPRVLLDQAWLRFDLGRTLFITAGKQHVKWGTARFWNPTDFLSPQRRDPLALFDARTGATMLKVHVPWEARGWNFYAIGLLDNAGPADTLGRVGGAARAEVVLGSTELGFDAVLQRGRKPRFGFDFSSGLGPIDIYGELAVRRGLDTPVYRLPAGLALEELFNPGTGGPPLDIGALPIEAQYLDGSYVPQVSGGATWTFAYSENDTATVGVEYFYNPTGYSTSAVYPYLLFQGQFQPFFLGQHYAAVYGLLSGPGSWDDTNFILSNLGNLSDRSFITRLDVTHRALRYLSVEAFVALNYGQKGGEFRFALNLPAMRRGGQEIPPISIAPPTLQAGVGLRIDL
ncbi:hypothetical protein ATI61_110408 [Archangium gephyra]|uniref:Porin n=1 Tax=Archangium gephyra TaxID=48 RepID=A0AAC8QDP7_9BACT|nr:hypothetical protein [Archangium gephyra]AKJ05842.1 Hypothetical protein AA314_07468 [Archangium gephyra]REG27401.1 hypothetical protein ATI61_110408 [Archangium gephyra]